jgi:hypothetical protein
MWFHARVRRGLHLAILCIFTLAVLGGGRPAHAAPLPGVDLAPGESVIDLAWRSDASMVLLVQLAGGYALRRLDLASGDINVIPVPKEFGYFKPGKEGQPAPQFFLAPRGNALAVLESGSDALRPSKIAVYADDGKEMRAVNNRRIPSGFWPANAAWDSAGRRLYMTAQQYIYPDQLYSVGLLDTQTGEFQGVVLKDNVDLISDIACLSGTDALAVRCAGYQGQYPSETLIALIDLEHRASHVLHSRAGLLGMRTLGTGTLLVYAESQSKSSGGYWLLEPGAVTLRRAQLAFTAGASTFQATADGKWYGFLAPESELTGKGASTQLLLALQRAGDGKTVVTATPTRMFCFAPGGKTVCALAADQAKLYFYQLPED